MAAKKKGGGKKAPKRMSKKTGKKAAKKSAKKKTTKKKAAKKSSKKAASKKASIRTRSDAVVGGDPIAQVMGECISTVARFKPAAESDKLPKEIRDAIWLAIDELEETRDKCAALLASKPPAKKTSKKRASKPKDPEYKIGSTIRIRADKRGGFKYLGDHADCLTVSALRGDKLIATTETGQRVVLSFKQIEEAA